jgi:hypothetical protein
LICTSLVTKVPTLRSEPASQQAPAEVGCKHVVIDPSDQNLTLLYEVGSPRLPLLGVAGNQYWTCDAMGRRLLLDTDE